MEVDYYTIFKNIGMGTTIWSPLASGILTGKYNNGIPKNSRLAVEGFEWLRDRELKEERIKKVVKLESIAKKLDCSLATLSIAWCIHNPNVSTAILGATSIAQLKENLEAIKIVSKLTPQIIESIEAIMKNKPAMPMF
jgi:aryl-alcohol dehydrogenase-like predicted oxidoreductase